MEKVTVSMHQRNLQLLATEMFKVDNNMAPEILNDIFKPEVFPYELMNQNCFKGCPVYFVFNETATLSIYLASIHSRVIK